MTTINWQQPFVNTFKHFTIASDKNVIKHGDISTVQDTQIKSSVYKILGNSSASNFINMPKLSGQSLGLTGRYIYFLFKPVPNKCFSLHIDITTVEKVTIRVSFSNLFKEFKSTATWLQFPYVIQAPKGSVYEKAELNAKDLSGPAPPITKWTILCVDLINLTQTYSSRTYQAVRGYKLCANIFVKNVVTSDMLYEPGLNHNEAKLKGSNAFPRELAYPCEKYDSWHQFYDYVSFPSESFRKPFDSVGQSMVFVCINKQLTQTSSNDTPIIRAQIKNVHSSNQTEIDNLTQPKKSLSKFSKPSEFQLPLVGVQIDAEYTRNSLRDNQEKYSNGEIINFVSPEDAQRQNQEDIHVYPFKSGHKVISSDSASSIGSFELNENESRNEECFDFKRSTEPKKVPINNNQTILEPDPILSIQKLIGFGPGSKFNCYTNCVKWSHDNQYLIYGAQAIVIAYHVNTSVQWCFVGHAEKVTCLCLTFDDQLMASGQTGPHSLIRLWNFQSRKCLSIFRSHDHLLSLLEFSHCGNYLCGVGKDKQGKSMLVLWDVKEFKSSGKKITQSPNVIAKAHTDVHIARILFVPYDSSRLITCGRDNVRFWRLKNDSLRSCAVNLSLYIQSLNMMYNSNKKENEKVFLDFTDICVNTRADSSDNFAYACTRTGQIFVFNISRIEIEFVRVLEPMIKRKEILVNSTNRLDVSPALRLNSLTVSDKFCATGSDDGFVRIWPLDFSQVSVEAEHEASIGVVRFSPDCSRICTATLNGNLGILDVNQKDYVTLIRSHTDSILDFSFDSTCSFIATSSLDSTVRVWNYKNCRQLYDFSAPNEQPTRLCFHPIGLKNRDQIQAIFACGFNSGKIRILNVTEAKLLLEIQSPHDRSSQRQENCNSKYEITDLKYSNNGKRLITGDMLNYLCLYDAENDYTLLRMLPNSLSSLGSLTISPDNKNVSVIGPNDHLITVFESLSLNEILRIDIASNMMDTTNKKPNADSSSAVRLEYSSFNLNHLLCVTSSNKLIKFDCRTGRLITSVPNIHRTLADCLTVSEDGRFLVTSGDNCIKVWDYEMRLEKNFQTFIGHSSSINRVLFSPDNSTLISVGDSIVFWNFLAFKNTNNDDKKEENFNTISNEEMPQGRRLEDMRNIQPIAVVREIESDKNFLLKNNLKVTNETKSFKNPAINDYNSLKIFNESTYDEKLKAINNSSWPVCNISFERPRTPPVAADNLHIETIAVNCEIEDTFLNSEITFLESNLSSCSQSEQNLIKKFSNLPNFVNNNNIYNNNTNNKQFNSNQNDTFLNRLMNQNSNNDSNNTNEDELSENQFLYDNNYDDKTKTTNKPNVTKHLVTRKKESINAKRRYLAPEDKCGLKLNSIIGYNGKYSSVNMTWSPLRDFFAFTIGTIICIEDLKNGKQKLLHGHQEDISVLALRYDCIHLASASGQNDFQCLLTIWDCVTQECVITLYHKNAINISCMKYSPDDRFLVSISDFRRNSLNVWNTFDYSLMTSINHLSYYVNEMAWNPCKCNEFALCGQNKFLSIWNLEEKSMRTGKLRSNDLDVPMIICEQQRYPFDFTSICYSEDDFLLFASTSFGLVTVWNTNSNTCFLNWQAETNEIDVLISMKNRLITGCVKGNLKLWNVNSIHEMKRDNAKKASLRLEGLIVENEIELKSNIKSCQFDESLEIGIAATTKGTLWYINWKEESSVRLMSTHTARITQICCINDKFLSTTSMDGSLCVWSLNDRERIVQFEINTPATCQTLLNFSENHAKLFAKLTKTSNKTSKNPLIIVGYSEGSIRIYDLDKKNISCKIQPFNKFGITCLNHCKNSSILLAGNCEGQIAFIDLNQLITTRIIDDHKGSVINCLDSVFRLDKDLTCWLASSNDGRISVWHTKCNDDLFQMIDWINISEKKSTNEPKKSLCIDQFNHSSCLAQFVPNTASDPLIAYIFIYDSIKEIVFYSIIKKQKTRTMNLSEWPICMSISNSCELIGLGTKTRLLQLKDFNNSTFQDYVEHSDSVSSVCFSNDGKKFFSTSFNEIFIWDVKI